MTQDDAKNAYDFPAPKEQLREIIGKLVCMSAPEQFAKKALRFQFAIVIFFTFAEIELIV